jgi:hypothetical protein
VATFDSVISNAIAPSVQSQAGEAMLAIEAANQAVTMIATRHKSKN